MPANTETLIQAAQQARRQTVAGATGAGGQAPSQDTREAAAVRAARQTARAVALAERTR